MDVLSLRGNSNRIENLMVPSLLEDESQIAPRWSLSAGIDRFQIVFDDYNEDKSTGFLGFEVIDAQGIEHIWEDVLSEVISEASFEVLPSIYVPKTPLGRNLWMIREKIIASGVPLLGMAEIEEEIADRRGEIS